MTTAEKERAAEVAKGLSEAQKRLLSALPSDRGDATDFWNGEYRKYPRALTTRIALQRKNLVGLFGEATPLGLAVHNHLTEQDK